MTSARAPLALAAVAALAATGCASANRCVVPLRPLPPPAAEPLPIHAGVVYAAGLAERTDVLEIGGSSWAIPVGAAAVEALNAMLPTLFAVVSDGRVPQPPAGGADAILGLAVRDVRYRPGPFRPERAGLTATAILTDRAGAELAQARATVEADGEPVHGAGFYHCDALGTALAAALADAAARVRDEMAASPRLREWARARAAAAPVATGAPAREGGTSAPAGEASAPPLPAPPPQPEAESRRRRAWIVPRWIGGGWARGRVEGTAPGIGTQEGDGWDLYLGWDFTEWLALSFRGRAFQSRVTWTPDPSDTDAPAESGLGGMGLLARLRPGRVVDPWVAVDLAYHSVNWDEYLYSVGGWGWLLSAGVDLRPVPWGAVRLGLSYSSLSATTSSGYGQAGPLPGPEDDGAGSSLETLWLTAGWIFDLGPRR